MLSWIREKFGPILIGLIVGAIGFVFAVSGIFSPKSTSGLHEAAVAGLVNGDAISLREFQGELERRLEFFKGINGGQTLTEAQLKQFRIKEAVFGELVSKKVLLQAAQAKGMMASDSEVLAQIQQIPAFQVNGKFDSVRYKQILESQNPPLTAFGFEKSIRDDLTQRSLAQYFRGRARVSDAEIKSEYLVSKDQRNIKYVLLTNDAGAKQVPVSSEEVQAFLAAETKLNIAKNQFEEKKATAFKGKTFDQVKAEIARAILAASKTEDIQSANKKLAEQVAGVLTASASSDAKVNTLIKSTGVQVKSTGPISVTQPFLPGVGEAKELLSDAFSPNSPIDPVSGKAKVYLNSGWALVAIVSQVIKPDLTQLEKESEQLRAQIMSRKERQMMESMLKELTAKAKVEKNEAIVGEVSES